jgi:hypothetical protein
MELDIIQPKAGERLWPGFVAHHQFPHQQRQTFIDAWASLRVLLIRISTKYT